MNSAQDTLAGGLPHSEIPGSPIARIFPGLFAACHVLHRLSVPRHPPDALLFALDRRIAVAGDAAPPPRTGPSPMPCPRNSGGRRPRMKTLLSDTSEQAPLTPACPPRSHHNSLFTLQSTPPRLPAAVSPDLLRTSPSLSARPRRCCLGRPLYRRHAGGGGERIRTDDLLLAKQALSQLSYTPAQKSDVRRREYCQPWHLISRWWAREDLNLRPHAYQARALTS